MVSDVFLDLLHSSPEFHSLLDGLKKGFREQMVYGLGGSLKSLLVAALRRETGRPVLVITAGLSQAVRFREDLATWLPGQEAVVFPAIDYMPFEVMAHSPEVAAQRLGVLERLCRGDNLLVVAPAAALMRALVPRYEFAGNITALRRGGSLDALELADRLARQGYERVEMVEAQGQFARRGDIFDIWPLSSDMPVRLEADWDEIGRIQTFDPATQRSVDDLEAINVGPAREFVLPADVSQAMARIRQDLDGAVERLRKISERKSRARPDIAGGDLVLPQAFRSAGGDVAERLRQRVEGHVSQLGQGAYFEGVEHYAPFFYDRLFTLMAYFGQPPVVVVDEPVRIKEATDSLELRDRERQVAFMEKGGILPGQLAAYMDWIQIQQSMKQCPGIYLSLLLKNAPGTDPQNVVSVVSQPVQEFHGQWPLVREELQRWLKQRYRVLILAATAERQQRLRELLQEADINSGSGEAVVGADGQPALPLVPPGGVVVAVGGVESGFQWPGIRLVTVTDGEVFGRVKKRRRVPPPGTGRDRARVASYQDLKVGDYVVHRSHGIGRYLGVRSEVILGITRDYLVIQYAGTDRLKIPTDQVDQIQKYVGPEGAEPRLSRMGGTEWSKVKSRVKESIREMAAELLRIQAMRQAIAGHQFPPDTVWQREFEDAFPYEETPDQVQAVQEIKGDMERTQPMDRLLLGDVGYGKTEVALRSAFKSISDSRQVAILVPTTILAQQHYATCKQRFAGFPIEIEVLNRFRTYREQQQILNRLARGEIDLIIGTHRLLGDDVRFKNLGLVVVDEEQRFGVQHKEKLKMLRSTVDILTLSATPIPRTLHMSMLGLRDISVITTPPEDRYPVETFVAELDDELVRDAIDRELHRGGQVYYLHNRVQSIEKAAAAVQQLVPDARVAVAHGQMKEEHLERVMLDFVEGEYDILVATTIIENGLDIPRVNTIIVEEADRLGLAQLYQLRGRVGRSNRLAYAYFLYRRDQMLTEEAEKRLQAIRDFTELGSGFKIAMRDLEIRGAGNILGPEQHGFIMNVGFDLYCQLLEEAVRELKGEEAPPPEFQPTVELTVDAYIPDYFIDDTRQKIAAYKRLMAVYDAEDIDDVRAEWEDRYGPLPPAAENLITLSRIKIGCRQADVAAIHQLRDRVTVKFAGDRRPAAEVMLELQRKYRGRVQWSTGRAAGLVLRVHEWGPPEVLLAVQDLLALVGPQPVKAGV